MSEAIRSRRSLLPWLVPYALMFALLGFCAYAIAFLPPGPQFVAEAKECDKQVSVLLTTHDAIDLQRASFIIRRLNCNIGDRLLSP